MMKGMQSFQNFLTSIDRFQQKHRLVAFPVAIIKRYGDEEVGKQAALITYYGFLSLFPMLLAFITIIGLVAIGDTELQAKISEQAFKFFPALGEDLQNNLQTLRVSGLALIIQILILLYGARGVASTLQDAFNYVWHTGREHKTHFLIDNLRSFAMIFTVGIGVTIGTALSYFLTNIIHLGIVGNVLVTIINVVVSVGLLLVVFRLGTASRIKTSHLVLGAVIAGCGLLIVQRLGGIIMAHELPRLRGTYGTFALTLGMLFWIFLQAQIIMYALVATAVKAQKDWPKKLFD